MSPQHDAVSGAVNQALHQQDQLHTLKKELFLFADDLRSLYGAYQSLEVITAGSSVESDHCCSVLNGLSYRFETLLARLEVFYKKDAGTSAG